MRKVALLGLVLLVVAASSGVAYGYVRGYTRVMGKITAIDYKEMTLVVNDKVKVQATPDTVIWKHMQQITFDDLNKGDTVCVVGELQGEVLVAKHIAVMACH